MNRQHILMLFVVPLASCGDGSQPPDPYLGRNNEGRIVGGIEGLRYYSQSIRAVAGKTEIVDIEGTTNDAGLFRFGTSYQQVCEIKSTGERTCRDSGPSASSPMLFTLCGVALPQMPGPSIRASDLPRYTAEDMFTDSVGARNFASIALMANVLDGDPARTGIKLSSALQGGQCQDFNWYTTNIQQDAASFQEVARTDGRSHEWPSDQALDDYMSKMRRCVQAGQWAGYHQPEPTSARSTGLFHAFIDFDGRLEGYMDWSGSGGRVLFGAELPVLFSGVVDGDEFNYSGTTTHPIGPNLNVNIRFYPDAAIGTWSADNLAGTTEDTINNEVRPGMYNGYNVGSPYGAGVPKYRFIAKDIDYRVPGTAEWHRYILIVDVGYNGWGGGRLSRWPPRRVDEDQGNILEEQRLGFDARITAKNKLEVEWSVSHKRFELTFDPNSISLTGPIFGEDGIGEVIAFTPAAPLRGCRM